MPTTLLTVFWVGAVLLVAYASSSTWFIGAPPGDENIGSCTLQADSFVFAPLVAVLGNERGLRPSVCAGPGLVLVCAGPGLHAHGFVTTEIEKACSACLGKRALPLGEKGPPKAPIPPALPRNGPRGCDIPFCDKALPLGRRWSWSAWEGGLCPCFGLLFHFCIIAKSIRRARSSIAPESTRIT